MASRCSSAREPSVGRRADAGRATAQDLLALRGGQAHGHAGAAGAVGVQGSGFTGRRHGKGSRLGRPEGSEYGPGPPGFPDGLEQACRRVRQRSEVANRSRQRDERREQAAAPQRTDPQPRHSERPCASALAEVPQQHRHTHAAPEVGAAVRTRPDIAPACGRCSSQLVQPLQSAGFQCDGCKREVQRGSDAGWTCCAEGCEFDLCSSCAEQCAMPRGEGQKRHTVSLNLHALSLSSQPREELAG